MEEPYHPVSDFYNGKHFHTHFEVLKHDTRARLRIDALFRTTPFLEKSSFVLFEEGLVVHDYIFCN
jgi:hypothetical protein